MNISEAIKIIAENSMEKSLFGKEIVCSPPCPFLNSSVGLQVSGRRTLPTPPYFNFSPLLLFIWRTSELYEIANTASYAVT